MCLREWMSNMVFSLSYTHSYSLTLSLSHSYRFVLVKSYDTIKCLPYTYWYPPPLSHPQRSMMMMMSKPRLWL